MPKPPRLSLVCAGPISQTTLERLPNLAAHIGPVKAANFRVARRVVNTLDAGMPVTSYDAIAEGGAILLNAVNERREAELIAEMSASGVNWSGCCVLLYGTDSPACVLNSLGSRQTATFTPMPGHPGRYLFEGDLSAVRFAVKLFGIGSREFVHVTAEQKARYLGAYRRASARLWRLLFEADEEFRASGLESRQTRLAVERFTTEAMNLYRKGVKPSTRDESPV